MIENKFSEISVGELKLQGYSNEMLNFVINNQLLDESTWQLFTFQFKNKTDNDNRWRGEYWGKMMRGASLCYKCTKNEKLYSILKSTVLDIISTQESDGRISTYPRDKEFDGWDIWGRKYVLLGLLYFYDICKTVSLKKKIKITIEKHLDYIISHVGTGKNKKSILQTSKCFGGLNSSSILEPVVKTYMMTGKTKYLKFASYIVKSGFSGDGNFIKLAYDNKLMPYQYPHKKAYEMMSCFQGLLEYYKIVEDEKYLTAVINFFDAVAKTDLTICGSSGCEGEMFNNSSITQTEPGIVNEWENRYMQETCVTVTWMNLCYTLLKFTGDAKYANYIEQSALNAMYGAVNTENQPMKKAISYDLDASIYNKPRESFIFDSYSPMYDDRRGKGIGGFIPLQNGRSYGCCACIGSAGIAIAELYKVSKSDDGIYINGYSDYLYQTEFSNQKIKIRVKANFYKSSKIKINVTGGFIKLRFRIPNWCDNFKLIIDGILTSVNQEQGYALIEREWESNVIEILLGSSVKKVELNDKVAVTKGPIILARDERFDEDVASAVEFGRTISGKQIKNNKFKANVTFAIKTKDGYITMCDYASAGKAFDDDKCKLSVWLDKK